MKNKTKKILAGLGLGMAIATAPLFTGCSSDITFNQADLDRALHNVNEYLETQNNYSSEFAKNYLYNYLIDGFTSSQDSKFGMTVTQRSVDKTGRTTATYTVSDKVQSIGNKTIFERNYDHENEIEYQEIEFNPTTGKYNVTNYNSDIKYQVLEDQDTFDSLVMFSSPTLTYKYVLEPIGLFDNFTMDILDDGTEVFKTIRTYSESGDNFSHECTESLIIEFKEQKLISIQSILIRQDLYNTLGQGLVIYQDEYIFEFDYNIEDIIIDKTLYTLES